jgi:predicted N-acyltransferase
MGGEKNKNLKDKRLQLTGQCIRFNRNSGRSIDPSAFKYEQLKEFYNSDTASSFSYFKVLRERFGRMLGEMC